MARTNYTFQEAAHPRGTGLCPPAADFSGRPLPQDYPACGNPVCRTLPGAENQITHPKWVLCLAQPVAVPGVAIALILIEELSTDHVSPTSSFLVDTVPQGPILHTAKGLDTAV